MYTPKDAHLVEIVRQASTSSFEVAMVTAAVLLLAGAAVNAIGIRNAAAKQRAEHDNSSELAEVKAT